LFRPVASDTAPARHATGSAQRAGLRLYRLELSGRMMEDVLDARGRGQAWLAARFRTIQLCPKDLLATLRQDRRGEGLLIDGMASVARLCL